MTDPDDVDPVEVDPVEVERLRARLAREQQARRQAETIAEQGMRQLWEANRDLQHRVAERTAQLQRSTAALSSIMQRWATEIATAMGALLAEPGASASAASGRLGQLARLAVAAPGPAILPPSVSSLGSIADELLSRWQRFVARSGQLLTVSVVGADRELTVRWEVVVAAFDVSMAALATHGPGGSVPVELEALDDGITVRVAHPRFVVPDETTATGQGPATFEDLGPIGTPLTVLAGIVGDGGGSLAATVGPDGFRLVMTLPADAGAP